MNALKFEAVKIAWEGYVLRALVECHNKSQTLTDTGLSKPNDDVHKNTCHRSECDSGSWQQKYEARLGFPFQNEVPSHRAPVFECCQSSSRISIMSL